MAEVRRIGANDLQYGDDITSPAGKVVKGIHPVDVRFYGAVCDGTTDDAVAIQNALDDLPSGGTLVFSGMCAVGSSSWVGLTLTNDNVSLIGLDCNSGLKFLVVPSQTVSPATAKIGLKVTGSNVTISGMKFDSNSLGITPIGFKDVTKSTIIGNTFVNMAATGITCAVYSIGGDSNKYINNMLVDPYFGLAIGYGTTGNVETNAIISGNIITGATGNSITGTLQYGLISGNLIKNTAIGAINFGGDTAISHDLCIANNVLSDVAGGLKDDSTGGLKLYNVSVTGNVISNISYTGVSYFLSYSNTDNVTINGNSIKGTTYGIALTGCENTSISNNIMELGGPDTAVSGIQIYGTSTDPVNSLTINANTIETPLYGIYIITDGGASGKGDIINISNNTITNSVSNGIWIYDGFTNVNLYNNIISYGLRIDDTGWNVWGIGNVWGAAGGLTGHNIGYKSHSVKYGYGTAAPTTGTWSIGDTFWNTAGDNVIGWKCTSAGTPGTWKYMQITLEA